MQLLIVDDNKNIRDGIKNLLRNKLQIQITEADNGMAALNMAIEENYDILLIDITMPIMDGIEATKYIIKMKPTTIIVGLYLDFDRDKIVIMEKNGAKKCVHKGDLDLLVLEKVFHELLNNQPEKIKSKLNNDTYTKQQ